MSYAYTYRWERLKCGCITKGPGFFSLCDECQAAYEDSVKPCYIILLYRPDMDNYTTMVYCREDEELVSYTEEALIELRLPFVSYYLDDEGDWQIAMPSFDIQGENVRVFNNPDHFA